MLALPDDDNLQRLYTSPGFAVVAAGFFVFAASGRYAVDGRVSSQFMVGGYGPCSLGELLAGGLGFAMIARYALVRMSGFMTGACFVATGVSQYLGSVDANFARMPTGELEPAVSPLLYTSLFSGPGWLATTGMAIAAPLLPLMRRLARAHQRGSGAVRAAASETRREGVQGCKRLRTAALRATRPSRHRCETVLPMRKRRYG